MVQTNDFSDVSAGMWFNNAISTLGNASIITGYEGGTFRPNRRITRAELAAIVARFDDLSKSDARPTDIKGHWAEDLIESAFNRG